MGLANVTRNTGPAPAKGPAPANPTPANTTPAKPSLIRELVEIADYIAHVRNEIAALRANELTRDRLPMAHEELGSVVTATAGATNSIMTAAEEILGLPNDKNYRAAVEARMNDIFEACTFQDITGQRISKVAEALRQLESRLTRFATAVNARDAGGIDPAEVERRMRAELLILNGPQLKGPATAQDEIDALFA
jgi:chemotaxis protein CheZ